MALLTIVNSTTDIGSGSTSWTDVDLSGVVPAGTTGVMLRCVVSNGSTTSICIRSKGSSQNYIEYLLNGSQTFLYVKLDSNGVFQHKNNINTSEIFLHGYFDSSAVFFTDLIDKTSGSLNSWTDIDISSHTGLDTAIGAIFHITDINNNSTQMGLRKKGSTDDITVLSYYYYNKAGFMTGLDGSETCQKWFNDSDQLIYLVGYIKSGAVFHTNAISRLPGTAGSYQDLTALPGGATAGIYTAGTNALIQSFGMRSKGDTQDFYADITGTIITNCDVNRVCQAKTESIATGTKLYEIGYIGEYDGDIDKIDDVARLDVDSFGTIGSSSLGKVNGLQF